MTSAKLWGGRQTGALNPAFEAFNRSLPFDQRLVSMDIAGSVAWAKALGQAEVLKAAEVADLCSALEQLAEEVLGDPDLLNASDAEDVHAFVEEALIAKLGDLGKRLHTGRSRNDQVATDMRLYQRAAAKEIASRIQDLIAALVELAEREVDTVLPGYTHLQRAQPISAGHHALCYAEMLARDEGRLSDALARQDTCPLGSGALAGTAFDLDREALAKDLGFGAATANSLDAVASRDSQLELVFACSTAMLTLSRLAEDWIFFASQEAGFLKLSDEVTTGSSLMPQKKNPDALELLRGKASRVMGHWTTLASLQKGLPLAYNKDLQEDKEALFDAMDTTLACLEVAAVCVRGAKYDPQACEAACAGGHLDATDLADLLVAKGVPFRDAHERIGILVRAADQAGVGLSQLPPALSQEHLPELASSNLTEELSLTRILERRCVLGGTAPSRVRAAIDTWKTRLKSWNN